MESFTGTDTSSALPASARQRVRAVTIMVPIILLFLLAIVGVAAFNHIEQLYSMRRAVLRTADILTNVSEAQRLIADAETGQRGFLLTGKERYRQPFDEGKDRLPNVLRKLDALIEYPQAQGCLDNLKILVDSKMSEMNQTLDIHRSGGIQQALKIVNSDKGYQDMENIRSILSELKNIELRLYSERVNKLNEITQEIVYRVVVLAAISVLLLCAASYLFNRYLIQRENIDRRSRIVSASTRAISDAESVPSALLQIMRLICEELEWAFSAFWLVDANQNRLHCSAIWHDPKKSFTSFVKASHELEFEKGTGLPGRTWASGKPEWITAIQMDTNFPRAPFAAEVGLKSAFAIPIEVGHQTLGVLEFFAPHVAKPDKALITTFSSLAAQIGQLISRKEAEQKLVKSDLIFRQLTDNMKEIFWIGEVGATSHIYISPAYETIFGRPCQQLYDDPMSFMDAIVPEDRQLVQRTLADHEKMRSDGVNLQYRVQRPDGSTRWVESNIVPIVESDGQVKNCCGITYDITDRKEAERRVSEFYSTVSHELRTPLTSIRGAFGLLEGGKGGELSPKAMNLVKVGRAESERLVRLINDILDIKKIEAGRLELHLKKVSVSLVVERAVEAMQGFATEQKVTLKSEVPADATVEIDEDRIVQVLTNFISNAVKYSPHQGTVSICVKTNQDAAAGSVARISVKDQGPGIEAADLDKLFKMFQQVDSSDSRPKGGTGLGLAISKALVEHHGGTVGVDTKIGEGSSFWFELPVVKQEDVERTIILTESSTHLALLIEDDDNLSEIVAHTLADDGFGVIRVASLAEAREMLAITAPDVIILDIELPDGNGLELLQSEQRARQLPVVVVTGKEPGANRFSYPMLVDWINKPFDQDRLLRALEVAVASRKNGPARVLVVEDDSSTRNIIADQVRSVGAQCSEASTGEQAMAMVESIQPDLIILDVGLPKADGFDVVTKLRQQGRGKIPLIVYTARDLTLDERQRLTLGLTKHMTKGVTTESDFLDGIKTLLNGLLKQHES
jgi:PAS domain S-box-containing protein